MGSEVENIVDLGLVNYVRHPSNPNYIVFRFADKNRADQFEIELKEKKIWFEKSDEQSKVKLYYLFGIHKRDYPAVQSINFAVEGKNRSFLIPNVYFRWIMLLISIGMVVLAVVGYCSRPELLLQPDGEKTLNIE
ncbi:MAG: hypothetical protein WEA99_05915 [Brumimicrobium sp.]